MSPDFAYSMLFTIPSFYSLNSIELVQFGNFSPAGIAEPPPVHNKHATEVGDDDVFMVSNFCIHFITVAEDEYCIFITRLCYVYLHGMISLSPHLLVLLPS